CGIAGYVGHGRQGVIDEFGQAGNAWKYDRIQLELGAFALAAGLAPFPLDGLRKKAVLAGLLGGLSRDQGDVLGRPAGAGSQHGGEGKQYGAASGALWKKHGVHLTVLASCPNKSFRAASSCAVGAGLISFTSS